MKKEIHLATFLIFLVLICLPSLQLHTDLFSLPSLNENRNRIKVPDGGRPNGMLLEHIYNIGVKFTADYEKAYNDHYGFRDFLILLKNQLDYSIFNHSDDLLVGKNGYLFFRDMVERDLIKSERVPDEQVHEIQQNIVKFSDYLKQKGVQLVVLLCRDKESVYGDLIISPTAVRPPRVRSEEYVDFLSNRKDILFLDSRVLLERARQKHPIYYKTDFHWNALGASYMGRRLVNFLAEAQGLKPLWTADPVVKESPNFSGTQNLYLATFSPKSEIAYEVLPARSSEFETVSQPPFPFENYTKIRNSKNNVLPKTVVIGNSFTPYFFKTDLPAYFEEIGYIFKGHLRATPIEKLIPEGTKYLILQVNEFDLGTYYTDAPVWKFLATLSVPNPLVAENSRGQIGK